MSGGFIRFHELQRRKRQDFRLPLPALFVLQSLPVVAPTSAHPGNRQEVVSPSAGAGEGFGGRIGLSWRWGGSIQ